MFLIFKNSARKSALPVEKQISGLQRIFSISISGPDPPLYSLISKNPKLQSSRIFSPSLHFQEFDLTQILSSSKKYHVWSSRPAGREPGPPAGGAGGRGRKAPRFSRRKSGSVGCKPATRSEKAKTTKPINNPRQNLSLHAYPRLPA